MITTRKITTAVVVLLCALLGFSLCGCKDKSVATSGDIDDYTIEDNQPADDDDEIDANTGDADANTNDDQDNNDTPDDSNTTKPSDTTDANETSTDKNNGSQNTTVNSGSKDLLGIPDVIDTRTEDDGDILVLVNKLHAVSKDYKPVDMVPVNGDYSTNQGLELKSEAYDAYLAMRKAARKEEIYFKICSTYRTYSTQEYLYNNSLKNRGQEITNLRSAYPGRSEHHTGLAIDITSKSMGWGLSQDFINYPEGAWINDHCAEYGFIVRYPDGKTDITGYAYEPWHIRYVGTEVAQYIMDNGITLEEYLDTL